MTEDRAAQAARLRRSLAANPQDRVSWHNLAAAEGDLGRAAEAEAAARRAIALGIPAPETRLVLARALLALHRLDEAERTFEEAIALRPAYAQAHRDLAQLRWMRTGRIDAALGSLDDALRRQPHEAGLHLVRSIALEYADRISEALASAQAGLAQAPHDTQLLRQSAHLCAEAGQGERALGFAQSAASLAPADPAVQVTLCEALLAAGRIAEGEAVAARLHDMQPLDQHAIALRATAWRLLGDARYAALHDYEHLVHAAPLELPEGLLAELAPELESQHRFSTHPFQQSVRGGSQLPLNAPEMARPALRALFDSLQLAVHAHLARLGTGPDPFRSRNTGRARVTGAWSVRLASGGYHTDHVHPRGWLSSAFYVTVPDDMSGRERAGWLRLGRPGIATTPPLGADFFVEPKPGTLVLFPAYMWHGVEPFQSARLRMSVAFDALPA